MQTFNWNIPNTKCSQQATTISKFANTSVKWRSETQIRTRVEMGGGWCKERKLQLKLEVEREL